MILLGTSQLASKINIPCLMNVSSRQQYNLIVYNQYKYAIM